MCTTVRTGHRLSLDLQRFSPARLASLWGGESLLHWKLFQPSYPPLAVEVGTGYLHFVQLDRTKDKKPILRRYGHVEVPEGFELELLPRAPFPCTPTKADLLGRSFGSS